MAGEAAAGVGGEGGLGSSPSPRTGVPAFAPTFASTCTSSDSPASMRFARSGTRSPRTSTAPSITSTRACALSRSTTKCVPTTSAESSPHSTTHRRGPPFCT
jgi:hypothetical protein